MLPGFLTQYGRVREIEGLLRKIQVGEVRFCGDDWFSDFEMMFLVLVEGLVLEAVFWAWKEEREDMEIVSEISVGGGKG